MEMFVFGYISYAGLFTDLLFHHDMKGNPLFCVNLSIREATYYKNKKKLLRA